MHVNYICRNWTICGTLPLGSSSSTGGQIQWMARPTNYVNRILTLEKIITNYYYLNDSIVFLFGAVIKWLCSFAERTLQCMLRHASRYLVTGWNTGSLSMNPIHLRYKVMIQVSMHQDAAPSFFISSARLETLQLSFACYFHFIYLVLC